MNFNNNYYDFISSYYLRISYAEKLSREFNLIPLKKKKTVKKASGKNLRKVEDTELIIKESMFQFHNNCY